MTTMSTIEELQAIKSFVEWARGIGATQVQVGDTSVQFGPRPHVAAKPVRDEAPDDDETLSADERKKREIERRMFASS
jgi:hypothetical protein